MRTSRVPLPQGAGCHIQLRLSGTPGHRGAGPCHVAFSLSPEAIEEIASYLKARGLLERGTVAFCPLALPR
jgi:hypothetical protein